MKNVECKCPHVSEKILNILFSNELYLNLFIFQAEIFHRMSDAILSLTWEYIMIC